MWDFTLLSCLWTAVKYIKIIVSSISTSVLSRAPIPAWFGPEWLTDAWDPTSELIAEEILLSRDMADEPTAAFNSSKNDWNFHLNRLKKFEVQIIKQKIWGKL